MHASCAPPICFTSICNSPSLEIDFGSLMSAYNELQTGSMILARRRSRDQACAMKKQKLQIHSMLDLLTIRSVLDTFD